MKSKIDIVIPVYFALEETIRCIKSILLNTDFTKNDVEIILVDDTGSKEFSKLLQSLISKLDTKNQVQILTHDENKGFIEACHTGINFRNSDYKLLLNTDTVVTKNWLENMIATAESDPKIALVNPQTNNAPEINIEMPQGFNINLMNEFTRSIKYKKKDFIDLITPTGFCLLIKSSYIKEYGFFDKVYDKGYFEEADLFFRYLTQGLRGVISPNAFVYHRGEGSFDDRNERLKRNYEIFLSRYKAVFDGTFPQFEKNTVLNKYRKDIKKIDNLNIDVLVVSPVNAFEIGGIRVLNDICNSLNESGISSSMACVEMRSREGKIDDNLFNPIKLSDLVENFEFKPKALVYSYNKDATEVIKLANQIYQKYSYVPKIIHLAQDIEGWFEECDMDDFIAYSNISDLTISVSPFIDGFMKRIRKDINSVIIPNSTSLNFSSNKYKSNASKSEKVRIVTMIRDDQKRGGKVIEEAFSILSKKLKSEIEWHTFGNNRLSIQQLKNIKITQHGNLSKAEIFKLFAESDIFVEGSLFHGFGLASFEALFSGCRVISSSNEGAKSVLPEDSDRITYFEIGNSEELAEKLLKSIEKNSKNKPLSEDLVFEFSTLNIYPKYLSEIQKLISKDNNVSYEEFAKRSLSALIKYSENLEKKMNNEHHYRIEFESLATKAKSLDWVAKRLMLNLKDKIKGK